LQQPELGRSSKCAAAAIRFCRLLAYQISNADIPKNGLLTAFHPVRYTRGGKIYPVQWRLCEITVRPPATDKNQGYGQKLEENAGSLFFQSKKTFSGKSTRNDRKLRPGTYKQYVHDF
jgi:hypothetical protein